MTKPATVLRQNADRLYAALEALGPGFHRRKDIAHQLGKTHLQPVETAAMDFLIEQGRVEAAKEPIKGPFAERWIYRIKGKE